MSSGQNVSVDEAGLVEKMFNAVGKIHNVDERLLDAVTGLRWDFLICFVILFEASMPSLVSFIFHCSHVHLKK